MEEELEAIPPDEEMEVFVSQRGQTFSRLRPLAMRNLAIAQQRDKERYSLVRGGSWAQPETAFELEDYVLVKGEKPNTLEAPAYPHVPCIVELRPSGIVVLEGSDAARCGGDNDGRAMVVCNGCQEGYHLHSTFRFVHATSRPISFSCHR